MHTGERRFNCQLCDKRFKHISTLRSHEQIHTGERRYICQICDKRFTQISSLCRHKIMHTGECRFSGKLCDNRFFQASNHLHMGKSTQEIVSMYVRDVPNDLTIPQL